MGTTAELPLPAGLSASTFPAKLWRLVNSPRVRSVRWDSRARGLLIDRSLFERELLSPGDAQGSASHTFRATQFRSFVRQLYRYCYEHYGFHKVPGWVGSAAPGDAGAWLHYSNPCFRRDRPDHLLRIRRRSAANRQRPAAGQEGRRRPPCGSQQLPGARPLPDGDRPVPARREGPSRFRELYGEQPLPAEREVLRVPPCELLAFHGEPLLPLGREGPRSRFQELCGGQLPPIDREVLRIPPCSFQHLHREQQPPAYDPRATSDTSAPSAPSSSAGCAASMASSSAWNAPEEKEWPPVDLGFAVEQMIQEIRRSLPERSPSAQGNINVAPESSGGEPVNRAAAEETSSGTESCGNSSPEPEELDPV
ncbi:uncharacterized protein LOC128782286 [Vidua chalybeata]|uniref:uncharacterized protein LOC128782286 n=1 Tax=Vidua chalybeata TaxID=81927 RepID=UPI0023A8AB97|nr:uncharacterized protein LOC128782286 [Vidua chalybeata]